MKCISHQEIEKLYVGDIMWYLVALFLIIAIGMSLKVHVRIMNMDNQTDVVFRYGFIRIHANYEAFMNRFAPVRFKEQMKLGDVVRKTTSYFELYQPSKSLLSRLTIDQFHIVRFVSKEYAPIDTYWNTLYFFTIQFIYTYLKENAKVVSGYTVTVNQDQFRKDFDYDLKVSIHFIEVCIWAVSSIPDFWTFARKKKEVA